MYRYIEIEQSGYLQGTHDFYTTLISQNFLVKLSSSNKKRNQQLATATKKEVIMTYRVSRSASNYELHNDHPNGGSEEPYLHHYVHNPAQSSSVANIQQLATLQVSVISVVEFFKKLS